MRNVPIQGWSNSKFINPFCVNGFKYCDEYFTCLEGHIQVLLYLYMYGLNTSKQVCKLFRIYAEDRWVELPWRRLSKLIYRIDQTRGWLCLDEYTTMMNCLYSDAKLDGMVLDYSDKDLFNKSTKTAWDSWIKTWIFTKYPNILKELHKKFPSINLFY